ncbi:hypothetical protein KR018_011601 [Drosophila ironensis]|nr:hypothetical protein KR018_011601 [Drosophila ironensis]
MHDKNSLGLDNTNNDCPAGTMQDLINPDEDLLNIQEEEDDIEELESFDMAPLAPAQQYSLELMVGAVQRLPTILEIEEEEVESSSGAGDEAAGEVTHKEKAQQTLPEGCDPRQPTLSYHKSNILWERRGWRTVVKAQEKVMKMENKILRKINKWTPSERVTPVSLAELAKDAVIHTATVNMIESLKVQIRSLELKQLQLEFELQVQPHHPSLNDNHGERPRVFNDDVYFRRCFICFRQDYLDHQTNFLRRTLVFNQLRRQPSMKVVQEHSGNDSWMTRNICQSSLI